MEKRDFIGMFDVLKGILMLMVIFAHHLHMVDMMAPSSQVHAAAQALLGYQAAPIALFFIITGYDFHPARSLRTYVKRQAKLLLIPYAVSVLAAALLSLAAGAVMGDLRWQRATVVIAGGLYGCIRNTEIFGVSAVSVIALWFLPALFFSGVFMQILWKIGNGRARALVLWLLAAAAAAAPSVDEFQVPWFLIQSCASLGFLEVGRLLKKYRLLYKPFPPLFYVGAVLLALWSMGFSQSNVGDNVYQFWLLDYGAGILGAVVLLKIYMASEIVESEGPFAGFLEYFGRYSLYVLCLHGVEMLAFPWYEAVDLSGLTGLGAAGAGILLYGVRVLAVWGCCAAVNRIMQRRRIKR